MKLNGVVDKILGIVCEIAYGLLIVFAGMLISWVVFLL